MAASRLGTPTLNSVIKATNPFSKDSYTTGIRKEKGPPIMEYGKGGTRTRFLHSTRSNDSSACRAIPPKRCFRLQCWLLQMRAALYPWTEFRSPQPDTAERAKTGVHIPGCVGDFQCDKGGWLRCEGSDLNQICIRLHTAHRVPQSLNGTGNFATGIRDFQRFINKSVAHSGHHIGGCVPRCSLHG